MNTIKYVAFLRGINSGKNPTVKMEVLRIAFENLGFTNVKTIIASGNVIFQTQESDKNKLEQKIEKPLPKTIGFESAVIIKTIGDLQNLAAKNPFKKIQITPHTRPYVTFIKENAKVNMNLPAKGQGYTILGIFDNIVCSLVDLDSAKSPDLMKVLDKHWKGNTTRGWATIEKILKA